MYLITSTYLTSLPKSAFGFKTHIHAGTQIRAYYLFILIHVNPLLSKESDEGLSPPKVKGKGSAVDPKRCFFSEAMDKSATTFTPFDMNLSSTPATNECIGRDSPVPEAKRIWESSCLDPCQVRGEYTTYLEASGSDNLYLHNPSCTHLLIKVNISYVLYVKLNTYVQMM